MTAVEWVLIGVGVGFYLLAFGAMFAKAGYPGWTAFLMLVPVINFAWLLYFAIVDWPIEKQLAALNLEVRLQAAEMATTERPENPKSALHVAARRGFGDVIQVLLQSGADVNARDSDGLTALQVAKAAGQDNIADLLRNHGAE